jgi:hypothetical protein
MSLTYTQTDTMASFGAIEACTSAPDGIADIPRAWAAIIEGTAGTTELTVQVNRSDNQAAVMFQTAAIGLTSWASGSYTVRLDVTTANVNMVVTDVSICRVNNAGTSQESIGSLTGQSRVLDTVQVENFTVTGSATTALATDVLYIVIIIDNDSKQDSSIGITPSQNIDTPLVPATNIDIPIPAGLLTLAGKVPVAKLFENVPIPVGSLIFSGEIPVVELNIDVPVPVGSLTMAGKVPTLSLDVDIPIPAGYATMTGQAPTIKIEETIPVPIGSLILTGLVSILDHVYNIGVGSATLAGKIPSLRHTITIANSFIAITGLAPEAVAGADTDIPVPDGSLALTGLAPVLRLNTNVPVPSGPLTLAGLTPVSGLNINTPVPVGNLLLAGLIPQLELDIVIPVLTGSLSFAGLMAVISIGIVCLCRSVYISSFDRSISLTSTLKRGVALSSLITQTVVVDSKLDVEEII